MKGTKNSKALVRYARKIGANVNLVGFEWSEDSKYQMLDFNVESFGEVLDSGQDSERSVGWVLYDDFSGEIGERIELKRNWNYTKEEL